jgi:mRNA interferase RelE/StbE
VASYKVFIKPSAAKELEAVPKKDRLRIVEKVQALSSNPRPPGCEKLSGEEKYRIRQGNYRVLYSIEDEAIIVIIVKIAHRRDVYR